MQTNGNLEGHWSTWSPAAKTLFLHRLRQTATPWPVGWFLRADGGAYAHDQSPDLAAFHASRARFRLLSGGRGSGKTSGGAQEALCRLRAGHPGAVLNPDFENFKYSTWPEFRQWIPWDQVIEHDRRMAEPGWEPSKPFVIHFTNGATAWCKGLKDPDSARGPNINWLWYDEGSRDKTGMAWKIAIASVRIGPDPSAWVTATPRGKSHWTYKEFIGGELPAEVVALLAELGHVGPVHESFRITIHDNRNHLDPLFYASMLTAYTGWLRDQELDGKFVEGHGTLADRTWFKIVDVAPAGLRWVRFWDLAATEKQLSKPDDRDPDYTAGAKLARDRQGRWFLGGMVRGQWAWMRAKHAIFNTAHVDGRRVQIGVEAVAGFKTAAAELQAATELAGYTVRAYGVTKDKVARANPWLAQAQAGNFYLVRGPWNDAFLDEVEEFPVGGHDDQVDGVSGAQEMIVAGLAAPLPDQKELERGSQWD